MVHIFDYMDKDIAIDNSNSSNIDYYTNFTPSILHDALITRLVSNRMNDNDTTTSTITSTSLSTSSLLQPFYHTLDGILISADISQFTK